MKITCLQCGLEYEQKTLTQTYCTGKCRMRAKNARRNPRIEHAGAIANIIQRPQDLRDPSIWPLYRLATITPHILDSLANVAASQVVEPQLAINAVKALAILDRLDLDHQKFMAGKPPDSPALLTREDIEAQDAELDRVFSRPAPESEEGVTNVSPQ